MEIGLYIKMVTKNGFPLVTKTAIDMLFVKENKRMDFVIRIILPTMIFVLLLIQAIYERKKGKFDETVFLLRMIILFIAMK